MVNPVVCFALQYAVRKAKKDVRSQQAQNKDVRVTQEGPH